MNFEKFMQTALYCPGLGYYSRDIAKIGREGDFYTSPHLHPIFGAMLGRQVEEMWRFMGEPEFFHIVEMGAGMGYLAKDVLDYLKGMDIFRRITYRIVEPNPYFRLNQLQLLNEFGEKAIWHESPAELPPFAGCFLSNELLDAFPARLVEMEDELKEIYVSEDGDELVEIKMPCSGEVREYLNTFAPGLSKGYRTEVNLRIRGWLEDVSIKLIEGFILTVDYGYPAGDYYSEERNRGTLQCYYRHEVNEDPYSNIGEQDITAHVNFSSLKTWGEGLGLKTVGFCPQGTYLVSLGIDEVIVELHGKDPDPYETAKIKGLILPQGMGESHKVMVQYKGYGLPLMRGFSYRNHAGRL